MKDQILWAIGMGVVVLAVVFGFLMWLTWWLPQVTQ